MKYFIIKSEEGEMVAEGHLNMDTDDWDAIERLICLHPVWAENDILLFEDVEEWREAIVAIPSKRPIMLVSYFQEFLDYPVQ